VVRAAKSYIFTEGEGEGENVVKTFRERKILEKVIFRRYAWPSINPSAFPDEKERQREEGRGENGGRGQWEKW